MHPRMRIAKAKEDADSRLFNEDPRVLGIRRVSWL
jgi:hypothetical protein